MNHIEIMKRIIEDYGKKEFTHREIIKWTNTNCPYSVLKGLKKYYDIESIDESKSVVKYDISGKKYNTTVKYRKFKILKRKENNVKKPDIWRESKVSNYENV